MTTEENSEAGRTVKPGEQRLGAHILSLKPEIKKTLTLYQNERPSGGAYGI